MKLLLLAGLGFVFLWTPPADAACIDNGNGTWTVSALNSTEMNACIQAAASGATINVPAGSASWSITLPANKDLNIVGATVVTCSGTPGTLGYICSAGVTTTTIAGSPAFTIDLGASHTLSGFVLTGGDGERIRNEGEQNVNKHFRIHHNVLNSTAGWQPIRFRGGANGVHPQGIWDHNRIQNGVAIHTFGTAYQLHEGDTQHAIWAEDSPLGDSSKVVYVEANYFVTASGTTNFADGNYASRAVLRFNTTDGPSVTAYEFHSVQGENRGFQRWETYNNTHNNLDNANTCFHGMYFIRAGSGVNFNNAMTGNIVDCNYDILLDNVRSESDVSGFHRCDGTKTGIDQNVAGQTGWHCRDQIGVYRDLTRWDDRGLRPYDQALRPAYFWGNTASRSVTAVTVDPDGMNRTHIQANRDFYDNSTARGSPQTVGVRSGPIANRPAGCTTGVAYWATDVGEWNADKPGPDGTLFRCAATNVWTEFYKPFTYPHPWAEGASRVR